uniref:Brinker DNA-binding domain-containing protein n=1 Tax=Amphimedon queenslandica TaxID=400682 RepID=A0A1X7TEE4_AMPQE
MASKKRNFDVAFKLNVVEEAMKTSNRAPAKKFSIDEASVYYWRKQKDKLQSTPGKKRLPRAGRKAKLPNMEEQLASWIIELRSKNCRVTRAAIEFTIKN